MWFLVTLLILLIAIIICGYFIKYKVSQFTMKYFGTKDLKEAIEQSEIAASTTPKSVFSVENVSLKKVNKDFPDLNINELKAEAEKAIFDVFKAVENKDRNAFLEVNQNINSFINSMIDDAGKSNVRFDNIKIHRTVINRYEKTSSTANIYFQTSFEYYKQVGKGLGMKVQDRMKTEFIYVFDSLKYDNKKSLGLKCPNCGAPVKSLGNKVCEYCGVGIRDIVKKNWVFNKIIQD